VSETPNDSREPDKPQSDELGDTAYAAVPPPLPPTGDPAQGPVQDAIPGASEQPQYGFTAPGGEQPHQQQSPYQQQPQYGGQYAGQQQAQFGTPGPYQTMPPPPGYGQPYGYGAQPLPPGMPPLADWGQRATAFILDNGVAIVAGWIAGANINHSVDATLGLISLVGVVWAIINAVRAGRDGQSYGKKVMGIRLARLADGQPIGGGLGFLRLFLNWILWVACIVPGALNLLWPLWDSKNQTWSDKAAKSVVVKTR
jgi:uncharacterized RDD family membrane protein YckC